MRILVYGYGNPGRQDDGLGILISEYVETWVHDNQITGVSIDQNYQLNIEDAEKIADFDTVVFCDASTIDIDDIFFERITADLKTDFSMHSVTPSFVLGLCDQIYHKQPTVYQLHIKGKSWKFMQPVTKTAFKNLEKAKILITDFITEQFNTNNS